VNKRRRYKAKAKRRHDRRWRECVASWIQIYGRAPSVAERKVLDKAAQWREGVERQVAEWWMSGAWYQTVDLASGPDRGVWRCNLGCQFTTGSVKSITAHLRDVHKLSELDLKLEGLA